MSRSTAIAEIGQSVARRRRRTFEEKLRIIEESHVPGSSVADVARRYAASAQQVYKWRRQYRQGRLAPGRHGAQLLEVQVDDRSSVASGRAGTAEGRIEITLADGVRIAVSGAVGIERLEQVLGVLQR